MIPAVDGHDPAAVEAALLAAKAETERPTLVCCKTVIGKGSPNKQGTESCHGAALGEDEIALTREALGWHHDPFVIPDEVREAWDRRPAGARWKPSGSRALMPIARPTPTWQMSSETTPR
ncbi:MAG: hypothetical protein CM15mP25_2440 [Gammaproteobacteria bacterium]|nr:MAG: hypothetical protein CM15mP25_2440 [Gammaproteobacteria bacterium]